MNARFFPRPWGQAAIAFSSLLAAGSVQAAVSVDGTRGGAEGYTELAVQPYDSGFGGPSNALANIHYEQSGKLLNLFIGGRVNGNAIILFIDSKAGGVQSISENLIASGDEEGFINNLAPGTGAGMTFESGFQPDSAIRIYGEGTAAYISRYDFKTQVRTYVGQADLANVANGPVAGAKVVWTDVSGTSAGYAAVTDGVELALNLALLGVPEGSQTVKMMAVLVNGNSSYGSNHVLGPLGTNTVMAEGVKTFNFETESGTQTLSIPVNRPALVGTDDEDGDGISNNVDPFPLDPTRDITFHVNMNVERLKGTFTPPSAVQVRIFTGERPALSTVTLLDPDSDGIYSGTLSGVTGFAGSSFGTYKFITDDPNNTNGGYETNFDRSFNLGAAGVAQDAGTPYFSNATTLSYTEWAAANGSAQGPNLDSDNDGVKNGIEYFMGEKGGSFTPNPQLVGSLISWPHSPAATGVNFRVLTSPDLDFWSDVTDDAIDSDGFLKYTLPDGPTKLFVRLEVVTP